MHAVRHRVMGRHGQSQDGSAEDRGPLATRRDPGASCVQDGGSLEPGYSAGEGHPASYAKAEYELLRDGSESGNSGTFSDVLVLNLYL